MGQATVWVYKQQKLSAESFHITLMTEMELVSETLDFMIHLTWLSARDDFIGINQFVITNLMHICFIS
jgi:hypothetical protein